MALTQDHPPRYVMLYIDINNIENEGFLTLNRAPKQIQELYISILSCYSESNGINLLSIKFPLQIQTIEHNNLKRLDLSTKQDIKEKIKLAGEEPSTWRSAIYLSFNNWTLVN